MWTAQYRGLRKLLSSRVRLMAAHSQSLADQAYGPHRVVQKVEGRRQTEPGPVGFIGHECAAEEHISGTHPAPTRLKAEAITQNLSVPGSIIDITRVIRVFSKQKVARLGCKQARSSVLIGIFFDHVRQAHA